MKPHFVAFAGVVFIVLIALVTIGAMALKRRKRVRDSSWEELMRRLVPVNRNAIRRVALYRAESFSAAAEKAKELKREDIWILLGGMDGIGHIENNSEVLIDMAIYLQHWYPDAEEIAEELRLEANRLKWNVERLRAAQRNECLDAHFHFYGRKAAESYNAMLEKTIELYKHGEVTLLGDLQATL